MTIPRKVKMEAARNRINARDSRMGEISGMKSKESSRMMATWIKIKMTFVR